MSVTRIVAIVCVYAIACGAWCALGFTTARRSGEREDCLAADVEALWGTELIQDAPSFVPVGGEAGPEGQPDPSDAPGATPGRSPVVGILPTESDIVVHLAADHRKKGLIWYPTYRCSFDGRYVLSGPISSGPEGSPTASPTTSIRCRFVLPMSGGTYDDFVLTLDGKSIDLPTDLGRRDPCRTDLCGTIDALVDVAAGEDRELRISYKTRGIRVWRYDPTGGLGRARNLSVRVTTDFRAVDYPDGCLSPMRAEPAAGGLALTWTASDLITRAAVGVIVPEKLNPGPLTSRITFFAPVCLIFFFVLVATIAVLYRVNVHPMHYLFVAAGFFAFHLLLAYLADHVTIHAAFPAAAATSVVLVTTYLSTALRGRFPWKVALAGQAFFLVLFSYSFFLEGMTGLVVAIGSVVTLAFLMRVTARVDWEEAFSRLRGRAGTATTSATTAR